MVLRIRSRLFPLCFAAGFAAVAGISPAAAAADVRLELRDGWAIQSSARVAADGPAISTAGFDTAGWHAAAVPATVVAALVADGTFPDPYYAMNLRAIPGATYPVGENFSAFEMPPDSPFGVPWWYRTEFTLPAAAAARPLWLHFGGVNFAFDAWLNGRQIADSAGTAGSWRVHEFEVSRSARPGDNALAVRVYAPRPHDLAITFVDWNPMPPDKVMGLFRPVTLASSGPVTLRHPQVVAELNPPALDRARLTVRVFARNATGVAVRGTLRGRIGAATFAKLVELAAGEEREIVLAPGEFPRLVLAKPALWWPTRYGPQNLHTVELEFAAGGSASDRVTARFGIRQIDAAVDTAGHLVFRVNGKPILIRGAGWTSEMLLRSPPGRDEAQIRYVKDMGLNAVRLEGKLEDDAFFDACDREGILVLAGWCCCDHWEQWDRWDERDLPVALASLRDQILRLRGRASVLAWLNGSDGPPPPPVEQAYLQVLRELAFPDPVLSSATDRATEISGPTGVKMRGPYEWVPPIYWYTDTRLGGAHGFATEIGPGPSPPPLESLRRFLPPEHLWPIDEVWHYHCGGGVFGTLDVFNAALTARYGPAAGVEEYAAQAQAAAYESHRAMFEAFAARKYRATGVIQWMLDNAWPSFIWHLYDAYLRPGGSYFGAKKACEPVHVQYGYDDRSVVVVNSTLEGFRGLRVTARVLDLAGTERCRREASVDLAPDGVVRALQLPEPEGLGGTYFIALTLDDARGRTVSRNCYWLSTRPDVLDWPRSQWYYTPAREYADLTGLGRLAPARLTATAHFETRAGEGRVCVWLENPSPALAFFVHLSLRRGADGEEVLPILWEDNYVTLLPGERREIAATYAAEALGAAAPAVAVSGWNVPATTAAR